MAEVVHSRADPVDVALTLLLFGQKHHHLSLRPPLLLVGHTHHLLKQPETLLVSPHKHHRLLERPMVRVESNLEAENMLWAERRVSALSISQLDRMYVSKRDPPSRRGTTSSSLSL